VVLYVQYRRGRRRGVHRKDIARQMIVPMYPSVEDFSVSGVWLLMPTSLDNPARRRRVAADLKNKKQRTHSAI